MTPQPAAKIPVSDFRQILFWPLLLKASATPTGSDRQFKPWADLLTRGDWESAPTLPPDVTDRGGEDITYEEIVYFHPFVRDFLYGDGSPPATAENSGRPLLRFRRKPERRLTFMDVEWHDAPPDGTPGLVAVRLAVSRLELYLCKPLVAVLAVELTDAERADHEPLTLHDAMKLQSLVREVYPPYFDDEGRAGNCPHSVTFSGDHGVVATANFNPHKRDHFAGFTHRGAEPPAAAHWQKLLEPLKPFPGRAPTADTHFYQQIADDRMPSMTFLTVPNPRDISDDDYDRLTGCDAPGGGPPYAPAFLRRGRAAHAYDRYWDDRPDKSLADFDTRYLCSGYHYMTVARAGGEYTAVLADHFRRHYFHIGLLLHYHRAALLKFQDDMAEAVKLLPPGGAEEEIVSPAFRREVTYIQMTFMKFRARAWFTEATGQLQGQELFVWWSTLLGTAALFRQVDESIQRLYAAVAEYETRDLAKSQERLAKSQEDLASAALMGLPAALALAALSVLLAALSIKWGDAGRADAFWPAALLLALTLAVAVNGAGRLLRPGAIGRLKAWFMNVPGPDATSGRAAGPAGGE